MEGDAEVKLELEEIEGDNSGDSFQFMYPKVEIEELPKEKEKDFICYVCGRIFAVKGDLTKHIRHIHEAVPGSHFCDACAKTFKNRSDLYHHKAAVHTIEILKCEKCYVDCKNERALRKHVAKCSKREVPLPIHHCIFCSQTFSIHKSLYTHLDKQHNYAVKRPCDVCGKTFETPSSLFRHRAQVHKMATKLESGAGLSLIKDSKYNSTDYRKTGVNSVDSKIPTKEDCGSGLPNPEVRSYPVDHPVDHIKSTNFESGAGLPSPQAGNSNSLDHRKPVDYNKPELECSSTTRAVPIHEAENSYRSNYRNLGNNPVEHMSKMGCSTGNYLLDNRDPGGHPVNHNISTNIECRSGYPNPYLGHFMSTDSRNLGGYPVDIGSNMIKFPGTGHLYEGSLNCPSVVSDVATNQYPHDPTISPGNSPGNILGKSAVGTTDKSSINSINEVLNYLKTDSTMNESNLSISKEQQHIHQKLDEQFEFEDDNKAMKNEESFMIKEEVPDESQEIPNSQLLLKVKKTRRPRQKVEAMCDTCARVFSCKSLLKKHIQTAHIQPEDSAACEVCGKVFRALHLVQHHVREVHSSVTFWCEICGKTFGSKSNLKSHVQTHSTEKMHQCHLCEQSFNTSKYLSHHHIAVHKLEDTPCHVCGKMYKNKYLMRKHFKKYHVD